VIYSVPRIDRIVKDLDANAIGQARRPLRDASRPLFRQLKCYCTMRECSSTFSRIRSTFWESSLPIPPSPAQNQPNRHRRSPFRNPDVKHCESIDCVTPAKRTDPPGTRTETPCPTPESRFVIESQDIDSQELVTVLRNEIPAAASTGLPIRPGPPEPKSAPKRWPQPDPK